MGCALRLSELKPLIEDLMALGREIVVGASDGEAIFLRLPPARVGGSAEAVARVPAQLRERAQGEARLADQRRGQGGVDRIADENRLAAR